MIGKITFIDEELDQNELNETDLDRLQRSGRYKNLLFDFFFLDKGWLSEKSRILKFEIVSIFYSLNIHWILSSFFLKVNP